MNQAKSNKNNLEELIKKVANCNLNQHDRFFLINLIHDYVNNLLHDEKQGVIKNAR